MFLLKSIVSKIRFELSDSFVCSVITIVFTFLSKRCKDSGSLKFRSITMRVGLAPNQSLVVKEGLSSNAVWVPTNMPCS